jgi:hypothetical protein
MATDDDIDDDDFEDDDTDDSGVGKKIKKVKSILVDKDSDEGRPIYRLLEGVIKKHRKDLQDAEVNIAIAFRSNWKADAYGNMPLGKARIYSDLDVQTSQYSAVIELNKDVWDAELVSVVQREAWMHHLLCGVQVAFDGDGEVKVNDHGWAILRKRNPDTQIFNDNVKLFGNWHGGLQKTLRAFDEAKKSPLLAEMESQGKKKAATAKARAHA